MSAPEPEPVDVPPARGMRLPWAGLPDSVQDVVNAMLGSPVTAAVNEPGGFSPGVAARVACTNGRRAFVKAVGPEPNPTSPELHRREARILAALPARAPVPRLLGVHDDGTWVVLVIEEVAGRQPAVPWVRAELDRVLAAMSALAEYLTPSPVADASRFVEVHRHWFTRWAEMADRPPSDLSAWERDHIERLAGSAERIDELVAGDTLCHVDVRADNLLLTDDGAVTVVDWPWACVGPSWLDLVLLALNVGLHGGGDPELIVTEHPLTRAVERERVTALLCGLAGFFAWERRQPAPPGLPTLRAFQSAHERVVVEWLARRTSW